MKLNKQIIIFIMETFMLVSLLGCTNNHIGESSPFLAGNEKKDEANDIMVEPIEYLHAAGLARGDIIFIGNKTNEYGEELKIYSDDIFKYSIHDNYIVTGVKNEELWDKLEYGTVESLKEYDLVDKGHEVIKKLYNYYDQNSELIVDYHYNADNYLETITFEVKEKLSDSIINNNTFSLSCDGTLFLFTRIMNDQSLFVDERMISSDKVYLICIDELSKIKQMLEDNNGYLPEGMYIPGLPQKGNIIMFGDEGFELPDFTMDINHIDIYRQEKVMFNDEVNWIVELETITSWGEYDDIFNYLWSFLVNPYTGDIIHVEALSGGS